MRVVVLWQGLALATRGAIRDKQCILSTASFNKNRLNGTNPGLALYKETRRGVLENRLHQCNRETVRSAAATIPFVAFFQGQANTSICINLFYFLILLFKINLLFFFQKILKSWIRIFVIFIIFLSSSFFSAT